MSLEAIVDNDVLIKAACYTLLVDLSETVTARGTVAVLGAARFVVGSRLNRHPDLRNRTEAVAHWAAFRLTAEELEPTDHELSLSTSIEEAAMKEGVAVDSGESLLCAIAIGRSVPRLLTGDKRAIQAAEALLARIPPLTQLANRFVCLEQAMAAVSTRIGGNAVRSKICAEPDIDKALSICFECTRTTVASDFYPFGLHSYIEHLRTSAKRLLSTGPAQP